MLQTFQPLILKFVPAFSYILLGFFFKKFFKLSQKMVANLLFYIFVPLVVLKGTLLSDTQLFLILVVLSMFISGCMSWLANSVKSYFNGIIDIGILKCTYSYFNIGWFGVPIVYAAFGEQAGIAMTGLYVGGMLFGNTIGYLMVTKNQIPQPIIVKLIKVPSLYAMVIGFILHFSPWFFVIASNKVIINIFDTATLVTSILGMGLVGMSVSNIVIKNIQWSKLFILLFTRTLLAYIVVFAFIKILNIFNFVTSTQIKVLWLMPLLPIAANILVFTAKAEKESEFIGIALLFSTIQSCLLFMLYFLLT